MTERVNDRTVSVDIQVTLGATESVGIDDESPKAIYGDWLYHVMEGLIGSPRLAENDHPDVHNVGIDGVSVTGVNRHDPGDPYEM